jgi:transposase
MAKQLVDDALWEIVEPLLPPARTSTRGRPRLSDRAALTGILFVLRSGIPWEMLPQEMGCGSGMTCWRRLRDWHRAGVWRRLNRLLLSRLEQAGQIDWSRASIDSVSVRAKGAPRKKGALRGRTRRTAVNRARNAISW